MPNQLFWECKCGFRTPRDERTEASDLGPCPRCGAEEWTKGDLDAKEGEC